MTVQSETAAAAQCAHAGEMNHLYLKGTIAMSWSCSVLTLGLLTHANSINSWVTLALVAVVPPAILMHRWNEPVPSLSKHIQQSLR